MKKEIFKYQDKSSFKVFNNLVPSCFDIDIIFHYLINTYRSKNQCIIFVIVMWISLSS